MKKVLLSLFLSLLLLSSPLSATMEANLDKAFRTLGMAHNVTTGGGYQDQTGGFIRAGVYLPGLKSIMRICFPFSFLIIVPGVEVLIYLQGGLAISMRKPLLPSFATLEVMQAVMRLI